MLDRQVYLAINDLIEKSKVAFRIQCDTWLVPLMGNLLVVSCAYMRPGTPALWSLGPHFTFCSVEVVTYSVQE